VSFPLRSGCPEGTRFQMGKSESNANIERPTLNIEHRSEEKLPNAIFTSMFDVGRSVFGVRIEFIASFAREIG
jgi:hypothetical protein